VTDLLHPGDKDEQQGPAVDHSVLSMAPSPRAPAHGPERRLQRRTGRRRKLAEHRALL